MSPLIFFDHSRNNVTSEKIKPKFLMMPKTSLPDNVQQFQKVPKNVKIAHQNHFA